MSYTQKGDIKFFYETTSTASLVDNLGPAIIKVDGADLLRDPTFETAVLISLFTNARAANSDILPGTYKSREGYFGSLLAGFEIGSKKWLLDRAKVDETTLRRAEQYDRDALQWMIDDGIAESIESTAARGGQYQINQLTRINRRNVDDVYFKYFVNWQYQIFGGIG